MTIDALLADDGDLPAFTRLGSGIEVVRQRIQIRLGTFLGEWLLDKRAGLPILDWLQQKPPRVDAIGARIRREIETTPGVARVATFAGSLDGTSLTYSGTVVYDRGEVDEVTVVSDPDQDANTLPMAIYLVAAGGIAT